ncbi:DNA-binding transcriptional regulator YbjK [Actinokineospora alba]|uniref:DNA-binding transcriptional regulator YbjK n=1 Tax=Actinokineospora alba TaxID=504798 RepID=A0A1H0EQV8_9PSEU|nr:TetR family transcriptional regulator [Actinokineospora alba]TDP69189.1 TetR family transcriptional regulator [Actinokineospora alba]SDI22298.1 DNA-binding transcriptional regulator YbjK [Actinokineospora alba]SDN84794.1 DNA-binding transcriptional regulator YbjK [Actinokineospora alba]
MTRMSADERRTALVEAAIRVMARDGVAKATTRAIVAEADMRLGFFHYCFDSKEALLLQVLDAINQRNARVATEHVEAGKNLRDTVKASVDAYWAHVESNPGEHQVTYELTQYVLREPALATVARKQYENYALVATSVLETIAAATKMEWTVPLPILARFLHNTLDGITLNWIVDRDTEKARAVLDQVTDYLVASARRPRAPRKTA